jgi:cytochrome c553
VKRKLIIVAGLGLLAALAGFLVAASGVIPIKASSGHFAVTEWFLQFSKRRSVATHTLGMELEGLDDPSLVLKGAGHYETGCRPCHGSPELPHPRVARAMLPAPPYLPDEVGEWDPEELFYIVKHGIKFTGMPAWPAQTRDDEVRAVVAFLLASRDLDAAGYRRLVFGDAASSRAVAPLPDLEAGAPPPRAVLATCARCHGEAGTGRGLGAFPKLAGQHETYLFNSLRAYARDERHSGVMQPIAAGLSETEMRELARYYGNLSPAPAARAARADIGGSAQRGRELAESGAPAERIPACSECHGPERRRRNAAYPILSGQYAEYLVLQLELLSARRRGGSRYVHLMHRVAPRLEPQDIRDLAAYYASLPWPQDVSAR